MVVSGFRSFHVLVTPYETNKKCHPRTVDKNLPVTPGKRLMRTSRH